MSVQFLLAFSFCLRSVDGSPFGHQVRIKPYNSRKTHSLFAQDLKIYENELFIRIIWWGKSRRGVNCLFKTFTIYLRNGNSIDYNLLAVG